jgi:hypothetical protein
MDTFVNKIGFGPTVVIFALCFAAGFLVGHEKSASPR